MVKKTRQKRTHSATRHKKSKRGRGRGKSKCRTTKRGGMHRTGRLAATVRGAHNALNLGQMRPSLFSELFGREYKEKSENPVEGVSMAETAFGKAHTAAYNEEIHNKPKKQSPTVPYSSSPFTTPRRPSSLHIPLLTTTGSKYKTPTGYSTKQRSPPPPDLYGQGNANDRDPIPFDPREFAPVGNNPSGITIRKLNYDDDDDGE